MRLVIAFNLCIVNVLISNALDVSRSSFHCDGYYGFCINLLVLPGKQINGWKIVFFWLSYANCNLFRQIRIIFDSIWMNYLINFFMGIANELNLSINVNEQIQKPIFSLI